ncbi:MAG: HAMP domain-containing protein, partial [Bdellovibrionia bacterium]
MIPLRQKLVSINLLILLLAIVSFGTTTYKGLIGLSEKFSGLNLQRSESVKESYRKVSDENIQKIKTIYEQNLKNKGIQLLSKDSTSLASMIADNSYTGVAQFLQKTFENDRDIVLATYFTADKKDIQAWHFTSSQYKDGLVSPTVYDRKAKSWSGHLKNGKKVKVSDPSILELIKYNDKSVKFVEYEINGEKKFGFDCVIPFIEGKSGNLIKIARAKGELVGYLRYILSPEEMYRAISSEKATLEERLKSLETQNQRILKTSQETASQSSKRVLETLAFVGLLVIFFGTLVSLMGATRISNPVKILTEIAGNMEKGNYSQTIKLVSNDEIGILANAFQNMSNSIQRRDQELENINRNLEEAIELRTLELKNENRKISGLLNNMKQAVFAVSSDYKAVPPVSTFSNSVFKQPVVGKSIFEFLYKDLDPNGDQMASLKSALTAVYGEDDLQWDLMEGLFPKRIEIKGNSTAKTIGADESLQEDNEDRVLRISYSPLFAENQVIDKIMMVVEDITKVEYLEKEIIAQRQKAEILFQLTENDLELVKGYFSTAGNMLAEIAQTLRSKTPDAAMISQVLRHLHTVKGNSRSLDFFSVSKVTHEVETEVEALRKYLSVPEDTLIPPEELKPLREGVAKIRSEVQKYLQVGAQLFGLENDLVVKGSFEFHEKMVAASWDKPPQKPKIFLAAEIAQEIGHGELSQSLTSLSSPASEPPTEEEWLRIIRQSVYLLYNSPIFVEHSPLPAVWVALGLKLWEVSEGLEKYKTSGSSSSAMVEALAKIEDAWSYTSAAGLFFYAGYFRKIGTLLESAEHEVLSSLEENMWAQFLLTARLHTNYKLQPDELKRLGTALSQLTTKSTDQASLLKSLNGYQTWVVSLFNAL